MTTITIRFVTCDDIVSALIREKTWCDFSHVEFVLDDGTTLGAHAHGGVEVRPANYANFTNVKTLVIPCTEAQKTTAGAFVFAQVGKPYDTEAIAGIVFQRDWRDDSKWFCSELVAATLEACGIFNRIAVGTNRIVPRDILVILSAMFET